MKRDAISLTAAFVVVTICAVVGAQYGEWFGRAGGVAQGDQIVERSRQFQRVLGLLSEYYAEPFESDDAIYNGAIPAMLERLDPHSQFFSPEQFERLREEQRGSYAGVGMQIRMFQGRTIVDFPFPDTPAHEAGVRPGDWIAKVDGTSTDDFSVEEVARSVRGRSGTKVRLSLYRSGVERPVEVELVRGEIHRPTVPLAFFVRPGVGYLRVSSFGETTSEELDTALEAFKSKGLEGLILDLRGNHGGLLSAGVHMAARFLPRGVPVVSHSGRASRERRYDADRGANLSPYPMTVLVDCQSASASEIVAGALQDHDRALIVGSNTFGKGLVQSVFTLPGSSGMVLTTARYYTPSGRLIQRRYDDVSLAEYYGDPCSEGYRPDRSEVRSTTHGRPVYGGGGVTPDVLFTRSDGDPFERSLIVSRVFERFAQRFALEHPKLPEGWRPDEPVYEDLERFLQSERIEVEEDLLESRRQLVERRLKAAVYTAVWDHDEGLRVDAELDPEVRRAADLLQDARKLLEERPVSPLASRRPSANGG